MSGSTLYTLRHPVQLKTKDGELLETITSVRLRRLKGRDMRALDQAKGNGSTLLLLIAKSADLPPSTVDEFDGEDVTELGTIVSGFLGGTLPTGEPSSESSPTPTAGR